MRLLILFDIPTKTRENKKNYATFRKNLIKNGFIMLQYSVYVRICHEEYSAMKHIDRIKMVVPPTGSVRAIILTEKQYKKMIFLVGQPRIEEIKITNDQLLLF